MRAEYRKRSNIGLFGGILLFFLGILALGVLGSSSESLGLFALPIIATGYALFIWGCVQQALGKGYHGALGLLGFLGLIGLIILAVIPEKQPVNAMPTTVGPAEYLPPPPQSEVQHPQQPVKP